MQKVDGVTAVKVSLKDGLTIIDFTPSNRVTLVKLREIIKNNGFVSKDATVIAAGKSSGTGTSLRFEVSGTGEQLAVAGSIVPEKNGLWRLTSPAR